MFFPFKSFQLGVKVSLTVTPSHEGEFDAQTVDMAQISVLMRSSDSGMSETAIYNIVLGYLQQFPRAGRSP